MLVGLMLAGGVTELLSIGAVVPFLALLARSGAGPNASNWPFNLIPNTAPDRQLLVATALFAAAVVTAALVRLLLQAATQRVVLGAGHELTLEVQRRTLLQPYSYHVQQHSSALIASLEKVQTLIFGVLMTLMQAVSATLVALFILVALIRIAPVEAGLVGLVMALAYAITTSLTRRALGGASVEVGASYDERVRLVQDSLGGIRDIILNGSQQLYLDAFRAVDLRFARARARITYAGAAPRFIIEAAGMIVIAVTAVLLSRGRGGLGAALPALGALALGGQRLLPLLQQLYQAWSSLTGNRAILNDIAALVSLPLSVKTRPDVAATLPLRRAIRLACVSFTYPGSTEPVLRNVDATIKRGQRVALVGSTGSGKSTFADIMMGLLEPGAGQLFVDDVSVCAANRGAWQRNVAHVPQSIFLTDNSIAENIALTSSSEEIDPHKLNDAIVGAQLSGFVEQLPNGARTRVGERGARLSGGQRQRIAIARALYKGASLLVLDEATNALDEETEQAVLDGLDTLQQAGVTILIISHRASTIRGCDAVIRLNKGQVSRPAPAPEALGARAR